MRVKGWQVVACGIIFTLGMLFIMNSKYKETQVLLKVWTRFQPSSIDPLLFDLEVHHQTMRSVMASLVSKYKNGEIASQIGKTWKANEEKNEWQIFLDEKWTFENGELVTPEIIVKNFKRIIYLKNLQNSKSGFLEFLRGANEFVNLNDELQGLEIRDNSVVFKFIKPMPDFLEKISFGLYSIANPKDYDQNNGAWIDSKKAIASGAYRISKWNENEFELELRKNFYLNKNSNRFDLIKFSFAKEEDEIKDNDLIIREKLNPSIDKDKWTYASTTLENNITYVKVMKWEDKNSLFSNKKNRIKLRNIFYDSLSDAGFLVKKSFFPLSIKNIRELDYNKAEVYNYNGYPFYSQPYFTTPSKKQLGDLFANAFNVFCKKINAIPSIVEYPDKEEEEKNVFDIQFLGTGIVIDSPRDDIKFMFQSKQGINLPDDDGSINRKLLNDNFDFQEINSLIWEQGIIWPIRHYSMGFWIKNSSLINLTEMNLSMQPIDFQFLKKK